MGVDFGSEPGSAAGAIDKLTEVLTRQLAGEGKPASILVFVAGLLGGLRRRGFEAFGLLPQEELEGAPAEIRPFCLAGSLLEPLPRSFDLILALGDLARLPAEQAETAIVHVCQAAVEVLFTPEPLKPAPAEQIALRPPEAWAELFARQGFYRDVNFDASLISPWAVRLRKSSEPLPRIVRDYERSYARLAAENAELRSLAGRWRDETVELLRQELAEKDRKLDHLQSQAIDLYGQLKAVLNSRSWRIMKGFQNARLAVIPHNSTRERWLKEGVRTLLTPGRRRLLGSGKFMNPEGAGSLAPLDEQTYAAWIAANEPTQMELERQRQVARSFAYQPLFSIVTPVYNPPVPILRETLEAALAQSYEKWEFILADGGSTLPGVQETLAEYAGRDARFRVTHLAENQGISGNTNAALALANGDFVALFDHDDTFSPETFYQAAWRLNEDPGLDIFYFDEDKLSEDGVMRRDPFFKPDWSPEMLLSANYLTHPILRRSLVQSLGSFDPEMDGTQDWDLMLRCAGHTQRIVHIPKVLYHWRQMAGSTAAVFTAKPWVFERQLRAVENHFKRQGLGEAQASFPSQGMLRLSWPASGAKISIIIPNKEKVEYLRRCITSIFQSSYSNYEVIVVDNGSKAAKTLRYYETLRKDPRVRIVDYREPFNFSRANNLGAQQAQGELLLFLNNDTQLLAPDCLEEMARWAERPGVGFVGARLLYPDGAIQHAGVVVGLEGHASHVFWGAPEGYSGIFGSVDWYRNYSAITGACMMIRKAVFEEIGGFSEEYVLVFSDIEVCLRAIAHGYRNMYTPFARLTHFEGRSRSDHIPLNDILVGYQDMQATIEGGDPYFNPNLSYTKRLPTLISPQEESRAGRIRRVVEIAKREATKRAGQPSGVVLADIQREE